MFLQHMKDTHKPGEMPYVCQVLPGPLGKAGTLGGQLWKGGSRSP